MSAQTLDISSGGTPTITGASGGSVTGSSTYTNNLSVTMNFGEISASNTSSVVKVTIPIGIRSTGPYQVTVSVAGTSSANAQALQAADVGFGIQNFRAMGVTGVQVCTKSSHLIYSPFNNNPATSNSVNASGRVTYTSSVANISGSTVIVSGPRLSSTAKADRQATNGYIFDAIFVITPQFFAAGTTTRTFTFTISSGPAAAC